MTAAGAPIRRAVIALGSNLGDRESTIRAAVRDLDALPGVSVVAASGLVESAALKPPGVTKPAPNYLNAVILADASIEPLALLDAMNAIEQHHGRVRAETWGDRTLDLDLIVVDDVQYQSDRLTLPHPGAWQRAFVLAPWLQVEPDAVVPGRGRVRDLLAAAEDAVWEFPAAPLYPVAEGAAS